MQITRNILCLDAGFRNTGYAVWSESRRRFLCAGYVSFPPSNDSLVILESVRVVSGLVKYIEDLIERFEPRLVVAELPTGASRSSRSSACMAMAAATVIAVCESNHKKLHVIRPSEIKRWVDFRGRKSVPKELVIAHVSKVFGANLLPDNSKNEHVADAMACYGVYRDQYAKTTSGNVRRTRRNYSRVWA